MILKTYECIPEYDQIEESPPLSGLFDEVTGTRKDQLSSRFTTVLLMTNVIPDSGSLSLNNSQFHVYDMLGDLASLMQHRQYGAEPLTSFNA
jgi:hypothetical protein